MVETVKVHTCFKAENGKDPLTPLSCRCRKFIPAEQAAAEVARGLAQYVTYETRQLDYEEDCGHCSNNPSFVKSCDLCHRTGKITIYKTVIIPSEDIIRTVTEDGRRASALKTPRVQTLEKANLERAIMGVKEEQQRIEIYGQMCIEVITDLISGFEPADDAKTHSGRKYDFGRSI